MLGAVGQGVSQKFVGVRGGCLLLEQLYDSLHDSLVTAYLLEYAPGGVILDQLDELVRDAPLLLAHVPRLIRVLDSLVTACMTAWRQLTLLEAE